MSQFELPVGTTDPNIQAIGRHLRIATDFPPEGSEGFILVSQGPDAPAQFLPNGTSPPNAHVLADTTGLGAQHTTSGLTAGQVLRATGASTAAFAFLQAADLPTHTHNAVDINAGVLARARLPAEVAYEDEANTFALTQTFNGNISIASTSTITLTGSGTGINMGNRDIIQVNNLIFADPGPAEGLQWAGGNLWKIWESPDDLVTNSAGNLQFVQNNTRRMTLTTAGQLALPIATGTAPLLVASTTLNTNLNADLLDGQHGSFYQNASNLNAGNLAYARLPTGGGTWANGGDLTLTGGALTLSGNLILAADNTAKIVIDGNDGTLASGQIGIAENAGELWIGARSSVRVLIDNDATGTGLFTISKGTQAAPTHLWQVTIAGHLQAFSDDSLDLGAAGANRPRTGYFGTGIVVGTDPAGTAVLRATGNVNITGSYRINDAIRLDHSGSYTRLFDPDSSVRLFLGGTGDPGTYSDNTTHYFRSRDGLTLYVMLQNGQIVFGGTSPAIIGNSGAGTSPNRIRFNQGSPLAIEAVTADNSAYAPFRASTLYATTSAVIGTDPGGGEILRVGGNIRANHIFLDGAARVINWEDDDIRLQRAGVTRLLGTASLLTSVGDFAIGTLGTFDSVSVPDPDDVLRYNGTKWVPTALKFSFTDGDVEAAVYSDNSASAAINDGRTLNGAVGAVPAAPTVSAGYHSTVVDMGGIPPAGVEYQIRWSTNAGVTWSDALPLGLIHTTGDKIKHAQLDHTKTYIYQVRKVGSTTGAFSASSAGVQPTDTATVSLISDIILASQIATVDLASVSANLGKIVAGLIENGAGTHGLLISGLMTDTDPSGWNRFINLVDETDNFIEHERFKVHHNGSVTISNGTNTLFSINTAGSQAFWQDQGATQGLSVQGAIPGGWVRYIGLDDANTYFIKHPAFEVQHDGRVRVLNGANTLFEINAASTSAFWQNTAATAGLNVMGTVPGGWTRYINLNASGSFLKHERGQIDYDGTIKFYITSTQPLFNLSASVFQLQENAASPARGINITGTLPGSWTRYLNLNGSGSFLKHERGEWNYDGSIKMYQSSSQPLFKLDASDFLLQNDAASPTQGVLIDGTLPGTWTRYLNLNGSGSFLKHERGEWNYDGSVKMYQSSSQPMFKLDASDFLLQNDAASPTQGILIDGTLPGTWTHYLNLNGSGLLLKHSKLELGYDGSAHFDGQVLAQSDGSPSRPSYAYGAAVTTGLERVAAGTFFTIKNNLNLAEAQILSFTGSNKYFLGANHGRIYGNGQAASAEFEIHAKLLSRIGGSTEINRVAHAPFTAANLTTTSTALTNVASYSLPAGALDRNGAGVVITYSGVAGATNAVVSITFGATQLVSFTVTANTLFFVSARVIRRAASSQRADAFFINGATPGVNGVSTAENEANAITINFRCDQAGAGTFTLQTATVVFLDPDTASVA